MDNFKVVKSANDEAKVEEAVEVAELTEEEKVEILNMPMEENVTATFTDGKNSIIFEISREGNMIKVSGRVEPEFNPDEEQRGSLLIQMAGTFIQNMEEEKK